MFQYNKLKTIKTYFIIKLFGQTFTIMEDNKLIIIIAAKFTLKS